MFPTLNEQMDMIRAGSIDVLPEDELEKKIVKSINTGKPLVIKLGCDPSRPDLHIGHAVVLHKMRQFQDMGHHAILIIGDFTGMIGDPTGKSKTRPPLTLEETKINGQTYLEQATMILSTESLEIKYNSEWLGKMTFQEVISLAAKYTVARILERDDFSIRYKSGTPISIHELLYPLAQAMDSVAIKSDVELGGTDQKFNLLVAREIQKAYGVESQCIVTVPILEGTDGVEKMSKSLDNYIALTDLPKDMFGKIMSIPDNLITRYYKYATHASHSDVTAMEEAMKDGTLNPRDAKVKVAIELIKLYYNEEDAIAAKDEFEKIFRDKELPEHIEELNLKLDNSEQLVMDVIVMANLSPSKKEARRLIEQGGVYIDGERINDVFAKIDLDTQRLFRVGKRKFLKIKAN